jgi:hypothetical protein
MTTNQFISSLTRPSPSSFEIQRKEDLQRKYNHSYESYSTKLADSFVSLHLFEEPNPKTKTKSNNKDERR